MKSVEKARDGPAKGINDAKKYRQKLRSLKIPEEKGRARAESFPFAHSLRRRSSREMIKGSAFHSISRSSTCTPDSTTCHPLRTLARPFLSPVVFVPSSLLAPTLFPASSLSLFSLSPSSLFLSFPYFVLDLSHIHADIHIISPPSPLSIGVFVFFPPPRVLPRALTGGSVTYCSETKT